MGPCTLHGPHSLALLIALAVASIPSPVIAQPVPTSSDAGPAALGHIVVQANGPGPLRVIIDGVDVGATPWEGDLRPGPHTVAGRSSSAVAEEQSIEVTAGSRTAIDLFSSSTAAHMQVRTSDGRGTVFIDGVARGEGAFAGDVAPGAHTVVVTRNGYQRYEKSVTVAERQTWAETVTLQPVAPPRATVAEGERALEGIYGGFGGFGAFGVGSMGTELQTDCNNLGASSCATPSPIGGGAFGYVGYTWNPVGFELLLGGEGDAVKQTATFSSSTLPTALGPARTESFTFVRVGGVAAVRARATFQTRRVRGTIAGGLGVSYKEMVMDRDATATSNPSLMAKYVPGGVGYVSPAITLEAAVGVRLSQTLAVTVGALLWADNASIAGTNSVPAPSQKQYLVNGLSAPELIPTPLYHLATGTQVLVGPFLGMQFGP